MTRPHRFSTAFALSTFAAFGFLAACTSGAGSLGDACLRNDDCAEGACSALHCRLPPTDPQSRASGGTNALAGPTPPAVHDAGSDPADASSELPDAGTSTPDAGDPDAGDPDAGDPDAGDPDAGDPDASSPSSDAASPGDAAIEQG